MTRIAFLILPLCLSACASIGAQMEPPPPQAPPAPQVAETANARLADATARELAHLSRFDPAGLDGVEPELRALASALAGRAVRPNEEPAEMAPPPPPAPDMSGARSVLHGVHLASYRGEETARAGWATLQAIFPDVLGGLEPRLEAVEIGDRGVFLRLKAGPFDDRASARAACREIEAAGAFCQAMDFTGEALHMH